MSALKVPYDDFLPVFDGADTIAMSSPQEGRSKTASQPFDSAFLEPANIFFRLDGRGVSLNIQTTDKAPEALIEFSHQLHAFGIRNNISKEMIEPIEAHIIHLGSEFTKKQKPTPLTIGMFVTDREPDLDPEMIYDMTAWDESGVFVSEFSSVEAHFTNRGTKITTTKVPNFNDIFKAGRKKILLAYCAKPKGEGGETLDEKGAQLASVVEALGPAAAESAAGQKLREAIEEGAASPKVLEALKTLAEINGIIETSRTLGAVPEADAQIAALKNTLAEHTTAMAQEGGVPTVLVKPMVAAFDKVPVAASPAEISRVMETGADNDNDAKPGVPDAVHAQKSDMPSVSAQAENAPAMAAPVSLESVETLPDTSAAPSSAREVSGRVAGADAALDAKVAVPENKGEIVSAREIAGIREKVDMAPASGPGSENTVLAADVKAEQTAFKNEGLTQQSPAPESDPKTGTIVTPVPDAALPRPEKSVSPEAKQGEAAPIKNTEASVSKAVTAIAENAGNQKSFEGQDGSQASTPSTGVAEAASLPGDAKSVSAIQTKAPEAGDSGAQRVKTDNTARPVVIEQAHAPTESAARPPSVASTPPPASPFTKADTSAGAAASTAQPISAPDRSTNGELARPQVAERMHASNSATVPVANVPSEPAPSVPARNDVAATVPPARSQAEPARVLPSESARPSTGPKEQAFSGPSQPSGPAPAPSKGETNIPNAQGPKPQSVAPAVSPAPVSLSPTVRAQAASFNSSSAAAASGQEHRPISRDRQDIPNPSKSVPPSENRTLAPEVKQSSPPPPAPDRTSLSMGNDNTKAPSQPPHANNNRFDTTQPATAVRPQPGMDTGTAPARIDQPPSRPETMHVERRMDAPRSENPVAEPRNDAFRKEPSSVQPPYPVSRADEMSAAAGAKIQPASVVDARYAEKTNVVAFEAPKTQPLPTERKADAAKLPDLSDAKLGKKVISLKSEFKKRCEGCQETDCVNNCPMNRVVEKFAPKMG